MGNLTNAPPPAPPPHGCLQAIQSRKEGLVSDILLTRQALESIGVPEKELGNLRMRDLLKLSGAATAYTAGSSPQSASKSKGPSSQRASPSVKTPGKKRLEKGDEKSPSSRRRPWKRLADRVPTVYDDVTEYVDAGTEFAAGRYRTVDNPRFANVKASNEGRRRAEGGRVGAGARAPQRALAFGVGG